jgi:hypothetical protein
MLRIHEFWGIKGAAAAGKRDHAAHGLQGILKKNHLPVVHELARHHLDGHRQVEDRRVGLGGGGGGVSPVAGVRRGAARHGNLGQDHRLLAPCRQRGEQCPKRGADIGDIFRVVHG